ncbi:MAG: nitroreductase family protein [Clostridia bacterium]|nr:nitroreductase family protein [Clostridia bacterium]
MENMLEFIKSRRSTRKYLDKPVEEEKLLQVLEAGRYAPSGGNNQTTHFLVIQNPQVLADIADLAKAEFAKMEITPGIYRSMANSIRASKNGPYVFHFHAPVLIAAANVSSYSNNLVDCACALENMMLMANALDLGSCWVNQLKWLNENGPMTEFLQKLGLQDQEKVYGAIVVGYPDTPDGLPNRTPLPRTGNIVTRIP